MNRFFLGWSQDCARDVSAWYGKQIDRSLEESVIFCVPTQRAARRLQDQLVLDHGTITHCEWITPPELLSKFSPLATSANETQVYQIWQEALALVKEQHQALFTAIFSDQQWTRASERTFETIDLFTQLRKTLVEGNHTLQDLADSPLIDDNPTRWQALAKLEQLYNILLQKHGLVDSVMMQLAALNHPHALPDKTHIVMACVPDFMPAIKALLATCRRPVDIIINAPESYAHAFDECGLPIVDRWTHALTIDLPDETIIPCATPAILARETANLIATQATQATDICIGLLDASVAPDLSRHLTDYGIRNFNPAPIPVTSLPVLKRLSELLAIKQSQLLADWLALTADLAMLNRFGIDHDCLINQIDTLMSTHLPKDFRAFELFAIQAKEHLPEITRYIDAIKTYLEAFNKPIREAIVRFLEIEQLLEHLDQISDPLLIDALKAIHELAISFHAPQTAPQAIADDLALFTYLFKSLKVNPKRIRRSASFEGRLELIWTAAPKVILAGLNEGIYPDPVFSDPFLPNSLRKTLGLRHSTTQTARDAYILKLISCSRANPGQLFCLFSRHDALNAPTKPSSLLFYCDNTTLLARAKHFFMDKPRASRLDPQPAPPHPLTQTPFDLPRKPFRLSPAGYPYLSPSRITAFLKCPFNFFVQYRLALESVDPPPPNPDHLLFGTLIHKALEMVINPTQCETSLAGLSRIMRETIQSLYQSRFPQPISFDIQASQEATIGRAIAYLEQHIPLIHAGWQTIATERRFELKQTLSDNRTVIINGTIDRIDYNPTTNDYRIYDYKTTESAQSIKQHYLTEKKTSDGTIYTFKDLQLPIYELAFRADPLYQDHPTATITVAYIRLRKDPTLTIIEPFDDYNNSTALKSLALQTLQETITAILDDLDINYWPPKEPEYQAPILKAWLTQTLNRPYNKDFPALVELELRAPL